MAILKINGNERQFKAGSLPVTLTALLEHLNLNAATVVAEIDGNIVERDKFAETKLTDGQSIELLRFVGGGQPTKRGQTQSCSARDLLFVNLI